MKRTILLPLLMTMAVVGVVGGIGLWAFMGYVYYRTNDAVVESRVYSVDSPQTATLTNVSVKKGDTVAAGEKVATILVQGSDSAQSQDLTSPVNGSVLLTTERGSILTSGYPVVLISRSGDTAVGEASVFAFVDEAEIDRITIGQQADVTVDAYHGTIFRGKVNQIVRQAASTFADTPSADYASGNFVKVSQRVPVLINLDSSLLGNQLLRGTSAEVTIHLL
jgi:multidrug resistance efflux pump